VVKTLNDIIQTIEVKQVIGKTTLPINAIQTDSRKVVKGSLFVAVPGTKVDGHSFIQTSIENGAVAIVCSKLPTAQHSDITYIVVENINNSLGKILSAYYNNPSKHIKVIGITGTNGKTTTTTLLYKLFMKLGHTSGLLSTVIYKIGEKELEASHTTPDAVQLYDLLNQMVEQNCEYCFMEISSHAIHQQRISGIDFTGGIFSNITHDHLDYHHNFEEYLRVKKTFFDNLPETAFALTNSDDKNGAVMIQNTKAKTYNYSCKSFSDFKCKVIEKHFDGMLISIDNTEVWVKFIGDFNAYNLLAVYASAILCKEDKNNILQIISTLQPVDGRFQCFLSNNNITAIVDYAHTPDALVNVLSTIQKLNESNKGQIITVVGAGGDRDKTKRPIMAKVCAQMSDKVIITSDNPRSEEPEQIANEMKAGISENYQLKVVTILDRKEAIKTAMFIARPGDIVLIAGKGHETYQEIKGIKHHFDDREIVKEICKTLDSNT